MIKMIRNLSTQNFYKTFYFYFVCLNFLKYEEHMSNILFIADPLESLKIESDSSLALAQGAFLNGYSVFFCTSRDVFYFGSELFVNSFHRLFFEKNSFSSESFENQKTSFSFFSICFIQV
jgi:hypothetical protein